MNKTKLSRAIGMGIAAAAIPYAVQAQNLVIEEVTVVAQKRAESAQDVPLAITAISGETIENMGLNQFQDLTKVSPSLTIKEGFNKNENPIALRGIGTLSFSIGVEPSVAVVIDDIPVARTGAAFSNLSDIERIEVLRGPQSTLFGKNSSAGVLNIITKGPTEEFEASAEFVATDDKEYRASGSVSGMLTDSFGVRISAYTYDREGHLTDVNTGDSLSGSEGAGARAKLVWDITDNLTATSILEYNDSNENCCALTFRSVAPGAQFLGFVPQSDWLPGVTPSSHNTDVRQDGPFQSDATDWLISLKVDYAAGDHILSSITGYRGWEYDHLWDFDQTDVSDVRIFMGGPYNTDLLTQEIRLTSPESDSFEYVAGLYYTETRNDRVFFRNSPRFTSLASDYFGVADSESFAVYGQANWGLSDKFTLITGLRYNYEKISTEFNNKVSGAIVVPTSADDDVILGKLGLQYHANDDVMVFATYTQGYKGQAYDINSTFNQAVADLPVGAEESDAYEIGIKSSLFSGRAQFNATIFNNLYSDFQSQSVKLVNGALEQSLNNVGELETRGLEIEAIALISENFRMNLGAAYIDAEIKSYPGANCYRGQTAALGCDPVSNKQDLSGEPLNDSPDFKFTLAGDLDIPLPSQGFDGFLNFTYQWQDDVNFNLDQNPLTVQDAYGVLNLSGGISSKSGRYRLTVFVNNALDEHFANRIIDFSNLFGGEEVLIQNISRGAERYAGVRLKLNF